MPTDTKKLLLCNCEKSMVVDGKLIGKTLIGEELPVHSCPEVTLDGCLGW